MLCHPAAAVAKLPGLFRSGRGVFTGSDTAGHSSLSLSNLHASVRQTVSESWPRNLTRMRSIISATRSRSTCTNRWAESPSRPAYGREVLRYMFRHQSSHKCRPISENQSRVFVSVAELSLVSVGCRSLPNKGHASPDWAFTRWGVSTQVAQLTASPLLQASVKTDEVSG